ncbi:DNA invertase Pin-like site-specific DNA recombinase [Novosphingobium kunmingense]|uniref:DNA invertase Pin-like site-specific DNA recombinase n=1 Tax=Novosphingobium kunmingense TaxID=1211806 RepID=A0A2N0H574_9SPHN|nr:recombinase family protein [Novosphingobium kunmingense]PKB14100.1 DNA invertase Pin-like site-specific DNA recombinase [Novosphingobium kunmingense]
MSRTSPPPVRCAIYTRKSTEEGLEQAFNSLDAQREACAAYVLSQQHEGWTLLPDHYDDGGISGGTMDRPAMQRLLADVREGRVDVIVVYKVDRLTRRLVDFAKIVEVLDKAGASFVSVTQAFNTTNSMGRLTLNVLLSFAQFEREVTGERIRDKIAASKRKGMWMGGPVPIGYDVVERKLVINPDEANDVRLIFSHYLKSPSLDSLAENLAKLGVRSKQRVTRDGRPFGGTPFRPGGLRHILGNRIYLGEVNHKGLVHPGEHDAIIDRALWEKVQARLSGAVKRPRTGTISALAGRIDDADGQRLYSTHGKKSRKRYSYYVSSTRDNRNGWRLPAGDIEALVQQSLQRLLCDPDRLNAELGTLGLSEAAIARAAQLAPACGDSKALREALQHLDARVSIETHALRIELDRSLLAEAMAVGTAEALLRDPVVLITPVALKRRGIELRLVYASPDARPANRDPHLVDLIRRGWAAWKKLTTEQRSANPVERSHLVRLARLRFLAPDITLAIIEGRQPIELTARSLLRCGELPVDWNDQRKALGFA